MSEKRFVLTREFVGEVITARNYAAHIAELASELARAAGEPVQRPLSREQIERAVQVNGTETRLVMDALIARLEALREEGQLPEDAAVPIW